MKMTLQEFWDSNDNLVIHCDTKDKAIKFCEESYKMMKKWHSGLSYRNYDFWEVHKKNTCYSNGGSCGDFRYFERMGYQVINFDDIDWKWIPTASKSSFDLTQEIIDLYGDNIRQVWYCKTLQNVKGIYYNLSTKLYIEATYDGDKKELYIDEYKKTCNKSINF